jgi:hypothetical protein
VTKPRRFPRLTETPEPPAPPERGRLWYDFEIPDHFFNGLPKITNKVRWVRTHLPREKRVKIGRDSAWYESDIIAYRDSLAKAVA